MSSKNSDIKDFIVNNIAKLLDVTPDKVQTNEPFDRFGIDSISAVRMVGVLEDYLDTDLPSTLLWDYNNIDDLVEYLSVLE
ncbi:MAG: acyl carrier protein [Marinilabiliaceae bacterium]|nr:acyl carrier protein [Marinilabiliaceae bacterium]